MSEYDSCGEVCSDDRFELIARAKERLLDSTNIESSPDEMAVLDSILFRCWQMGWLDRYGTPKMEDGTDTREKLQAEAEASMLDRIENLVLAVEVLSLAVADLARLCDVRGHVFDAESAKRFNAQWGYCKRLLGEVLEGGE